MGRAWERREEVREERKREGREGEEKSRTRGNLPPQVILPPLFREAIFSS